MTAPTPGEDVIDAAEYSAVDEYSPVDMLELRSNPAYGLGYQEGWDDAPRDPPPRPRRDRLGLVAVSAAAAALILTGIVIGRASAAPREEQLPSIPVADAASLGAPHVEAIPRTRGIEPATTPDPAQQAGVGAPLPSPTSDPGPAPAAGYAPLGVPQVGVRVATRPCPCPVEVTGGTSPPTSAPASAVDAGSIGSPLQGVRGVASWYGTSGPGIYAAAGPPLRVGHWRGRVVTVCGNGSCIAVRLTDWCACPKRAIDLSADAFRQLAPLRQGLVVVTVTWGGSVAPATDVEP